MDPMPTAAIGKVERAGVSSRPEVALADAHYRPAQSSPCGLRSSFEKFPTYVIYPRQIAERGSSVAIRGHTTGSYLLGLRDEDERELTLIWLVDSRDGYVTRWKLIEDNAQNQVAWRLGGASHRSS